MIPVIPSSLQARMDALKESQIPFPLSSLLFLYARGNRADLYCNYFAGFKLLVSWFKPIDIPQVSSPLPIPKEFYTYDIQEIATILHCSPSIIFYTFWDIHYGIHRSTNT